MARGTRVVERFVNLCCRAAVEVIGVPRATSDHQSSRQRSGLVSFLVQGIVGAFRGDRPLVLGLLAVIALGAGMLVGPLQSYLDARERVEVLELQDQVLSEEVTRLRQRVQDLDDPEHIELLAREQQGFIWPGEVPYRIVPPEQGRPQIAEVHPLAQPTEPLPWYWQLWDQVQGWFGGR